MLETQHQSTKNNFFAIYYNIHDRFEKRNVIDRTNLKIEVT